MRDLRSGAGWQDQVVEGLPPEIADEVPLELFGLITALPAGGEHVLWNGPRVRVIEHPAHAQGHAALLVEGAGVLVAGDMLSDIFMPFPDLGAEDPIGDYLIGLERLEEVADRVDVLVPGHGSVAGADQMRARVDLDRAYVEDLRDGRDSDDPRIGPTATFGQDWLPATYQWQREQLAQRERAE
jgi:glyoxylase-like metal-dependent hydrolase (beta-lactamase superfamily II)